MTAQTLDQMILDEGEGVVLRGPSIPNDHPRLRCSEIGMRKFTSTCCWRGYIATWWIGCDLLFLESCRGGFKKLSRAPIHADWYSGLVTVGSGRRLTPGGDSIIAPVTYEVHSNFEVVNGRILRSWVQSHDARDFPATRHWLQELSDDMIGLPQFLRTDA